MVHFVGAGPGAPDLITRRGAALLQTADCIIYAGSLVNPALLGLAGPDCTICNSAEMTLEQVLAVMKENEAAHKTTVRLHTGDPCLYGAIREQMDALAAHGATMVIFLSIGLIDRVQDALLQGTYTAATPAAVVYKATWPEQKIVHCTVGTLAESTRAAGITKTALIVVGDFLAAQYDRSKLYDPAFTTEFRRGTNR